MKTVYETKGTCSKAIELDVDDATGIINSVQFIGGCAGNIAGISQLVRGMKAEDVISRLEGVRCGLKPTSCPDQLATALRQIITR
ncbi:MAG: TIGR03905 family TSCPD domain-containing protein [Bacteroidaceae bacterium]|nr:TIGR03905 family TSCPD domain-containing protein [Bacteroidaceae bacterium]